jgi:hypothetical protein
MTAFESAAPSCLHPPEVSENSRCKKQNTAVVRCRARSGRAVDARACCSFDDIDANKESYRGDLQRAGVLVFDLTGLRIDVHSRAFDDVTSVKGMIEERLALGPVDDGR